MRTDKASFRAVTKRWGVKLYRTLAMRDKTFEFTQAASRIGAAPQVRLKFSARGWHGYAIERVEPNYPIYCQSDAELLPSGKYLHVCRICGQRAIGTGPTIRMKHKPTPEVKVGNLPTEAEHDALLQSLWKLGMVPYDVSVSGTGWLDGKLVAFDFSECVWRAKEPGLFAKANSLRKAWFVWRAAGRPMRSPERRAEIKGNLCGPCVNHSNGKCLACGCDLETKISWATTSCPLDEPRWKAEVGVQ